MSQINGVFEDYSHPAKKGWIYLNSDKPINLYHMTFPIIWAGTVGGNKVKIIQKDWQASSSEDFYFEVFPEKYSYVINDIIDLIEDYLRILD